MMPKKPEKSPVELTPAQQQQIEKAIKQGQVILKDGGSKADAARGIFNLLNDLPRDSVISAFIHGATITQKGAPTYYYNVSRKWKRQQTSAEK